MNATSTQVAAETGFSGVVRVDRGDETESTAPTGSRTGARDPEHPRHPFWIASGNKGLTALSSCAWSRPARSARDDRRSVLGADLPLIDDAVTIEHLLAHRSGIGDYLDEEGDGEIDDYIFSVPLHALAETEAFLPALDGFPQKFPPGELLLLQRRIRRARARRRARQRPRLP